MRRPNAKWVLLTIGYAFLFAFSGGLLAAPPGKLPFYLIMAALTIGMIILETVAYRWIGVLFLIFSVLLSASEVKEGYELRQKMEKIRSHKMAGAGPSEALNICAGPFASVRGMRFGSRESGIIAPV